MTAADPSARQSELIERVLAAVVKVLRDRTYDKHAATVDLWEETQDHLRIKVAEALAAQPAADGLEAALLAHLWTCPLEAFACTDPIHKQHRKYALLPSDISDRPATPPLGATDA